MPTSISMPPWLSTAFLAGLSANAFASADVPQDLTRTSERLIDPENAWRRFQTLQKREAPTISLDGVVHRVVDFERYDEGLISYTREMREGVDTGAWRLFLQESLDDPSPMPLAAPQIRESLLKVYLDEALHVQRDEITMPEIGLIATLPSATGKIRRQYELKNGHRFVVEGCQPIKPRVVHRRNGEEIKVGQFPIEGLLTYLGLLPQSALSRVDEFRLSQRYHPGKSGSARREGERFVVRLYPFERILKKSRDDLSEGETADQVLVRFFYSVCHEAFGHPLIFRNRHLRREMMKIVAGGERPPSGYSMLGIEEWFSEGVAEFWRRYSLEGDEAADSWRFQYPYLSGLILHLLAVLEETAEPANENIEQWAQRMGPSETTASGRIAPASSPKTPARLP